MTILKKKDEGILGAVDALEIKFSGGESTLIKYEEAFPFQQQVFQVCKLNEVDLERVVSVQIVKHSLCQ